MSKAPINENNTLKKRKHFKNAYKREQHVGKKITFQKRIYTRTRWNEGNISKTGINENNTLAKRNLKNAYKRHQHVDKKGNIKKTPIDENNALTK